MGTDLQAQGPSISPVELKRVLDDLFAIELLGNMHRECSALFNKMQDVFGLEAKMASRDFVGRILDVKEDKWVSQESILSMMDEVFGK